MVPFTQPLFWQIRYLVLGLSKKNYKSSVAELHQLVSLYGYDAQIFFMRTLVEEIEFRDTKQGGGGGGGRDQLKIQLLQNEIDELEGENCFGMIMCQALRNRDPMQEHFLVHLCKVGKVQVRGELAIGAACLQSANEVTRREGARFLHTKVREYVLHGHRSPRLPEALVHALLIALRSPELEEERDRDVLFRQLLDLNSHLDMGHGPCTGLGRPARTTAARLSKSEKPPMSASPQIPFLDVGGDSCQSALGGVRACDLLEEICQDSAGAMSQSTRDVLALFPDLGTRGLAEIVSIAIRTSSHVHDKYGRLAGNILTRTVRKQWNDLTTLPAFDQVTCDQPDESGTEEHDPTVLMKTVKECFVGTDWHDIFEMIFDIPDLQIPDMQTFQMLLTVHTAVRGREPFPLAGVLRRHRNTAAQLGFLRFAIDVAPTVLDFTTAPPLIDPIPGLHVGDGGDSLGGTNHCWACCPFVESLLELAEVEDYNTVRALFDAPLRAMPEVLLVCICVAEDRSSGGLRAELLEQLVPSFFEQEVPNSTAVQVALSERAFVQMKHLLVSMHERSSEGLPQIARIIAKDELCHFRTEVLRGIPTELTCRLALLPPTCAQSLETWLHECLSTHGDAAAATLAKFLRMRLNTLPATADEGLPSLMPSCDDATLYKVFLDEFHQVQTSLSPESCRQLREVSELVHQKFPVLIPTLTPDVQSVSTVDSGGSQEVMGNAVGASSVGVISAVGPPPPTAPPTAPPQLSPEELEEASNAYFSRIYAGEMTVPQLIDIMKDFALHEQGNWKHEVYARMMQNLFDECRFFPRYPPQELTITGELFGSLINHDLVSATNLGLALRCVLEALRRPMHTKMFRFGILALEQFLNRLPVWPQLCHHLTQIDHLAEVYPSYVEYGRQVLCALPEALRHSTSLRPEVLANHPVPQPPPKISFPSSAFLPPGDPSGGLPSSALPPRARPPTSPPSGNALESSLTTGLPAQPPPREPPPVVVPKPAPPPVGVPPPGPPPPPLGAETVLSLAAPGQQRTGEVGRAPSPSGSARPSGAPFSTSVNATPNSVSSLMSGAHTVDALLNDTELQIEKPPTWFCDTVALIFNNLVKDSIDQKADELRPLLLPEYHAWLASYVVRGRASKEVNFHSIYIEFFEKLRQPRLLELVTTVSYECLRVLLKSVDQAVVSTAHRTVLKNLGAWLGLITLGRNKSLKSKQLDVKGLLIDAYESGRLTAILPLVCKILDGVQKSKVYKLPNPWTTAMMRLLAEIHDVPNLRTNLMFEVEVLCKHLDIKMNELRRSELLVDRKTPPGSTDLNNAARQAEAREMAAAASTFQSVTRLAKASAEDDAAGAGGSLGGIGQSSHHGYTTEALIPQLSSTATEGLGCIAANNAAQLSGVSSEHEAFIIPSLPGLVQINASIRLFQVLPALRGVVPHAVDRAIKEVISAVVERSVTISCLTTREMVTKDFAMEPDGHVLKTAAQLMVSSVAGSLALVTCREPLRVSLTKHLWQLLQPHCSPKDLGEPPNLDQVVHAVSTDNLELGCSLIEKAVVEKASKDIEDSIAGASQARKEHHARNPDIPYCDPNYIQPAAKWPHALPEILRPKPGPLSTQQFKVYKDFTCMPAAAARSRLPANLPPLNVTGVAPSATGFVPLVPPQEPPAMLGLQAGSSGSGQANADNTVTPAGGTTPAVRLILSRTEGQLQTEPEGPLQASLAAGADAVGSPPMLERTATEATVAESDTESTSTPPLSVTVQTLWNSMEQTIQGLLHNPPLLPPIDSANPQLHRQDDAIDACSALSMLPLDHELPSFLRHVRSQLSKWTFSDRITFDLAHRIFKSLFEAPQMVPQVHPPDTVSLLHLVIELCLATLEALREMARDQLPKMVAKWMEEIPTPQRYNVDVVSGLIRYQLITLPDFDRMLSKWIEVRARDAQSSINALLAVDFAVMLLQRLCLRQRVVAGSDFKLTVEALSHESAGRRMQRVPQSPVSPQEVQLMDSISKVIDDLHAAEVHAAEVPLSTRARQTLGARLAERCEEDQRQRAAMAAGDRGDTTYSKEMIIQMFEEWSSKDNASPDRTQDPPNRTGSQAHPSVLPHMSLLIRSEEAMERFFWVCCEHAVQRTLNDAQQSGGPDETDPREDRLNGEGMQENAGQALASLNFSEIDSFTRLVVLLMRVADKVQVLTRALSAIARALIRDCERREQQFNQRPYFRILLNLLMDMNTPDPAVEQAEEANFQLLSAFCNTFHTCNPMRVPNFAFAWLELISNRMFMPKLLMVKGQRGWLMFQRLLVQLLYFLEPYLRRVQLNDGTRLLYKGTVRVLLVLLHDFPEFLCDYHFSFCDIIPIPCVQIRNLILSAFPRNMKLPDPFMPNLKVDLLPDIKVAPRILANYTTTLLHLHLKADVDNFLRTRDLKLLETIREKLRLPHNETLQLDTKYNVPLLNALLLYVGVHLPQHGKLGQGGLQQNNPSLDVFMHLAHKFDYEGRYLFLSAVANHLRYPNTHTHYFSCVLLYIFAETPDEVVREQITRVLLERLIVHRPHPWGLLITFIELIKNSRYQFWNHSFVKCAPEVEKLFQSVAYTCLGTPIDRQNDTEPRSAKGTGDRMVAPTGDRMVAPASTTVPEPVAPGEAATS